MASHDGDPETQISNLEKGRDSPPGDIVAEDEVGGRQVGEVAGGQNAQCLTRVRGPIVLSGELGPAGPITDQLLDGVQWNDQGWWGTGAVKPPN